MIEQNSSPFSLQRFLDLLVGEIRVRSRSILLTSAVLAALMALFHLSGDVMNDDSSVLAAWLGPIIIIWGLIEASKVFDEMHNRQTMPGFLLLPASALEKTAAKFILVTLVFGVYLCLFGLVVSLLCAFLSFAILGQAIAPPALFEDGAGAVFQKFLLTQSVFFLGGAWFKKSQVAKTAISVLASFTFLAVFIVVSIKLLAPEVMFSDASGGIDFGAFVSDHDDTYLLLAKAVLTLLFIVVPTVSFALSWLRVREVQLSDGV